MEGKVDENSFRLYQNNIPNCYHTYINTGHHITVAVKKNSNKTGNKTPTKYQQTFLTSLAGGKIKWVDVLIRWGEDF
jgi:hypothetical protein